VYLYCSVKSYGLLSDAETPMPEDQESPLRPDETAPLKDDFLKQIWSLSSTLTEEAMAAASSKSKELGFDQNRGIVSLRESFINLSSARGVLEDAIDKQKLVQLPITVQKEILANLQVISKSLQGLIEGTDEIINLVNSIEVLNTSIWKYGLHNLSDEVLGYQKKLNQIKVQEVEISKIIAELATAQKAAETATVGANEVEQRKVTATASLEQIQHNSSAAVNLLEQIKDAGTKVTAFYATIQQQEKQSGELSSSIKTANNELLAADASIRKFYSEVEDHRRKITQAGEDAANLIRTSEGSMKKMVEESTTKVDSAIELLHKNEKSVTDGLTNRIDSNALETKEALSKLNLELRTGITGFQGTVEAKLQAALTQVDTSSDKFLTDAQARLESLSEQLNQRSDQTIEANQKHTGQLVDDLSKLKDQIKEQIQQATGFQLFGAFQSRQNEIAKSKQFWVYAIFILIGISACVTIWIAREAQHYNTNSLAFWVKLSITVPLGFALGFCTVQYNRERRLEEEYAFKASISVSLNPYRDLIHSILEKDGAVDQSKYSDFVVDAVRNVFTPPTDKVFDTVPRSGITEKALKQTAEIIGTAVKAAK